MAESIKVVLVGPPPAEPVKVKVWREKQAPEETIKVEVRLVDSDDD